MTSSSTGAARSSRTAWRRFVADNGSGAVDGRMRGIGEPIWADRGPDEMSECQLHESLINLAFATANSFRLACPYDTAELSVTVDRLQEARGLVRRRAHDAGLGERADDLVLAVNEILSNSLHHAHDDGALRVWDEPDGLVCEVRDRGRITGPLVGREEPAAGQVGGHGIWLVNLVCDLVQVRSSEAGSTVRMKMSHA
jgi:anti-sigma regulatory factor (Ser/Thr protein kinase)